MNTHIQNSLMPSCKMRASHIMHYAPPNQGRYCSAATKICQVPPGVPRDHLDV